MRPVDKLPPIWPPSGDGRVDSLGRTGDERVGVNPGPQPAMCERAQLTTGGVVQMTRARGLS